jgi:hypothetical protein
MPNFLFIIKTEYLEMCRTLVFLRSNFRRVVVDKQFIGIIFIKNGRRGLGMLSIGDSFNDFKIIGTDIW